MSSTNKTTYYELSQYVGSDKPTYLSDYNADMLKIDNGLHTAANAADTALTTANSASSAATTASTTASTALSTAQTASATASQAQTTAETALTNSGAAQIAAEEAETAARANVITNLAPAYDSSLTYAVGDLVTFIDAQGSGKLYKCIVAVSTPEAFNINKWDDVTTSEVYGAALKPIASVTFDGSTTTFGSAITELLSNLDISTLKPGAFMIDASDQGRAFSIFNLLNYRDSAYINFYHIELSSTAITYKLYGYEYGSSTPTASETVIKIDGTAGSQTDIKNNVAGVNRVITLYN